MDEMAESIHSTLVENLFDEEEALLNLHMNVIQGETSVIRSISGLIGVMLSLNEGYISVD